MTALIQKRNGGNSQAVEGRLIKIEKDVSQLKTDVALLKWGVGLIVGGVVSLVLKAFIFI